MLSECKGCKDLIAVEDTNINSFYVGCKILQPNVKVYPEDNMDGSDSMTGGFEIMYEDVQSCLFFKPHCGKCGGNCAKN